MTVAGLCVLTAGIALSGQTCPTTDPTSNTNGNDGITGQFVGSTRCGDCHKTVHTNWMATLHAGALETLEAIGQGTNENCIGCHVVGFGQEGGFVDRATTNDLAGVGCEACHGPSKAHVDEIENVALRPAKNLAASVCGQCHTGEHHPTFEEWETAGHAHVTEHPAESFEMGSSLNSCGKCHSGEFFVRSIVNGETLADDELLGQTPEEQIAITCAVCHDPHMKTGNATAPEDGRDYQLRFPENLSPTPTNTIDATTNASRFNVCGQCHHSRGRDWTSTSRGPHHSVQANIYAGEMPMPDSDDDVTPLVPSRVSVHSFAAEQCATCHLYRQDFESEEAPAIAGHSFDVNTAGCAATGCHPSSEQASAALTTLQAEVETRLTEYRTRLGNISTWGYSSEGGPADQSMLSDNIKKARFLINYVANDGSGGIHNPDYVRDMLDKIDEYLDAEML
ncbi:MAG TPA: multiheme c-type cytochrome [Phycisphaerae bacterium]|nr:multiheme c-type cytochrome [Phycisphaerae bacterium]